MKIADHDIESKNRKKMAMEQIVLSVQNYVAVEVMYLSKYKSCQMLCLQLQSQALTQ